MNLLADRSPGRIFRAFLGRQHYIALMGMFRVYPHPVENLRRYLTGRGEYPCNVQLRTPLGLVAPRCFSHHDLLTINEIFCRGDYAATTDQAGVVVDIGSNIGLSALYFLTRNDRAKVYCYEPDPRNAGRLKENLKGFEARFELHCQAVADVGGQIQFGIEPTGRYGGIGVKTGTYITVDCANINDVLEKVLRENRIIDILKMDIEGHEIPAVLAIRREYLARIRRIYLEATPGAPVHPEFFTQRQYGDICQLTCRDSGGA